MTLEINALKMIIEGNGNGNPRVIAKKFEVEPQIVVDCLQKAARLGCIIAVNDENSHIPRSYSATTKAQEYLDSLIKG